MNEEIIQNLNERLDRAIIKGREMLDDEDLQDRITELKLKSESAIRENPLRAVLIGLAAGFIAAKIFSSDDD